jgi:hypothetical protein
MGVLVKFIDERVHPIFDSGGGGFHALPWAVRPFTARQYRLSIYTTQATRHADILTTTLSLLFGALILTWRESSWTSVILGRRSRRRGWWTIGILLLTLPFKTLTLPFEPSTLFLQTLALATIRIRGSSTIIRAGPVVRVAAIVSSPVRARRRLIPVIGIIGVIEGAAPSER